MKEDDVYASVARAIAAVQRKSERGEREERERKEKGAGEGEREVERRRGETMSKLFVMAMEKERERERERARERELDIRGDYGPLFVWRESLRAIGRQRTEMERRVLRTLQTAHIVATRVRVC